MIELSDDYISVLIVHHGFVEIVENFITEEKLSENKINISPSECLVRCFELYTFNLGFPKFPA